MSDTPIAERLAAELGMPWPLRPPPHEHMDGELYGEPDKPPDLPWSAFA